MSEQLLKELVNKYTYGTSILDIGCGDKKYAQMFCEKNYITVDAWPATKPHHLLDLEKIDLYFQDNYLDHVLMLDFVEHVEKERAKQLIEQAKKICIKNVIIFTPNFWTTNEQNIKRPELPVYYNNTYNLHKSLWIKEDFSLNEGWIHEEFKDYIFVVWNKNENSNYNCIL